MRLALLPALLLAALASAKEGDIHCHGKDTPDGKPCEFVRIYPEMNKTDLDPRLNPVGSKILWTYTKFLASDAYHCPWFGNCEKKPAIFLGYINFHSNYGNSAGKDDHWNGLGFLRCMEYMGVISKFCGGHGGTYETGFGEINAICIQA
ncbi:hypothetical protein K491DRAFT_718915 [Lophiostoma macrostomum CBS 122681]|uniref:Uncharacterized protein n=1 Tax=Lophiostoma macrostomum CBS 122681 TaxID=1314788 RepID=A0A6A6SZL1_9PLEO|nr:hypothetical protein K491DRAFT_718915 [Lophiostoma macrostomum CBS 122681]